MLQKLCLVLLFAWIERGERQYQFQLTKALVVPNWNYMPSEHFKYVTHCTNPLRTFVNPLAYTDVPETAGLARSINP